MNASKKLLAALLSLVLLLLPLSAAAQGAEDACPTIRVHGFMGVPLIADRNDPNSEEIWWPNVDAMLGEVKDMAPALIKDVLAHDWDDFADRAIALVDPYFSPSYYDNNGQPKNNSGVYFAYPSAQSIQKTSYLDFRYDWRRDPLEIAEDLHDFIEYVCSSSGASQVNIHVHSFGGVVFISYLRLHGNTRIRGACLDSTAIFGESYTGDLMRGEMIVTPDAVEGYLNYAFSGNEYAALISALLRTLKDTGLLSVLTRLGTEMINAEQERVSKAVLVPMFINWLSIWSMIPDDDVDAAMDFVFNKLCRDEDRSELRAKVEAYNQTVRPYKEQVLRELNETANVYVLSRYGFSSIPITPSYDVISDGTVDTKYSSFGAVTSPYGKTLTQAQMQGVDPRYISPDQTVNAATCLFPEQTWFIRGLPHANEVPLISNFAVFLLSYPGQATVDTFPEFPRFLQFDQAQGALLPDDEASARPRFLDRLRRFFDELKKLLAALFAKIGTK